MDANALEGTASISRISHEDGGAVARRYAAHCDEAGHAEAEPKQAEKYCRDPEPDHWAILAQRQDFDGLAKSGKVETL